MNAPTPQNEVAVQIIAEDTKEENMNTPLQSQQKPNGISVVPDSLQQLIASSSLPTGLEEALNFTQPSFLKIVQDSSKAEMKSKFSVGSLVVMPEEVLFASSMMNGQQMQESGRIPFTPLFFYAEWCCWNPVTLSKSGSISAIRSRSKDPKSEIAQRAKSFDSAVNTQPYPEDPQNPELRLRFVEHLNFVCLFNLSGWEEKAVLISFFRGSYKNGSSFISLASMRKAPIYACQFELFTKFTPNPKGDYYSLCVANPQTLGYYTTGAIAERNLTLHNNLKKSFAQGVLQSEYGEEQQPQQQPQPQQQQQQPSPINPGVVSSPPSTKEQAEQVF